MTKLLIMMAGEARSGKDTSADLLENKLKDRGFFVTRTYFARALKQSLKQVFGLTDDHVFGSLKETPFKLDLRPIEIFEEIIRELHHGSLMSIDVEMHKLGYSTEHTAMKITNAMCAAIVNGGKETLGSKALSKLRGHRTFVVSPRQLMQWWGTEAVREGAYQGAWIDCVKFDIGMDANPNQIALVTDARFDNEVEAMKSVCENTIVIRTHRGNKVTVTKHASEAGISDSLVDFEVENDDTLTALRDKLFAILNQVL